MKFRGRMSDFVAMRDFTNIISVVSRIAKQCVLRLTPDVLYFNVADDRVSMVWAELSQDHFFNEYIMKGVTDDQNEIYLEIESVMLAKSLASFRLTAKSVKLKLTNKRQPCLTFEIELPSLTTEARRCIHDIPVRVLPRREWVDYQAPSVPDFDVSIDMPQLKQVRNVVERMRNMSPTLTLMADKTGMLVLKINTNCATVATHFQGLQGWQSSQMTEDEETVSATVDVKKFSMFLAWEAVHPEAVKCNILQDKMINLFLSIADYLKIHYFIPAIVN